MRGNIYNYGERVCMNPECKKKFTALYPAQVTCSEACRKKRKNGLQSAWSNMLVKRLKEIISELDAKCMRLQNANAELLAYAECLEAQSGNFAQSLLAEKNVNGDLNAELNHARGLFEALMFDASCIEHDCEMLACAIDKDRGIKSQELEDEQSFQAYPAKKNSKNHKQR